MTQRVKPCPKDLRDRAVRLVLGTEDRYPTRTAAIRSIAARLGIGSIGSLRDRVRQAGVGAGARPGTASEESDEVKRLKREVAELRRANEVLKA
jgi:transposase